MMVADWIIGMWTATASGCIVTSYIMCINSNTDDKDKDCLILFLVGVVMVIFSVMHYSGM